MHHPVSGINSPIHSVSLASPLAEVISDLQHAAIWRYLDHERQLTDKEVFPSLVRHCGTRCRSLFVTHLNDAVLHTSEDFFYFAEHIVLSIAPS